MRCGSAGEAGAVTEPFSGRAIPIYREVDRDPRWHQFLREIDPYTGQQRQALLIITIADGSESRIVALFKGFMQEAGVGGAQPSPTRGHRASGKPTYTRETIGQLYEAHRKGAYAGREAEWARIEADIFAAQREGRVQGVPYLTK